MKKILPNSVASKSLLVIPAYNEQSAIYSVLIKCKKYFPNILVIDDDSKDETYLEALKAQPNYILRHAFNSGQGVALSTGLKFFINNTNFEYLITFDADGQHDPLEAFNMLNYAKNNSCSVVIGTRFHKNNLKKIPFERVILLKLGMLMENIFFGIKLSDAHNGLRVLKRDACVSLEGIYSAKMAHATEIPAKLIKRGFKIFEFPCSIDYDLNKKSTSFFSSLNIVSDLIQKK